MEEIINGINMKDLQEENLRILSAFVSVCEENNIWYSLAYGTMLGAVRHNGFIPWDRDVDVYIKITDVPQIRKLFAENLPANCKYMARGITKKYTSTHEILQSTINENAHLDMYPLVGAPDNKEDQAKFTKNIFFLRKILKSKYVDIRLCLPKNRVMVLLAKFIDMFISDKKIEKIYSKYEHMYNYDTSEYVVALANYGKASNCVKKSVMMNINKHQFEHLSCNIPVDYDSYLTGMYGDYMTPRKY